MWAEQAVFTSLDRDGQAGYHVVSRSEGISEADSSALTTWSPTEGSLIVDAANRTSINFHPMPEGRHALSRTFAGSAEYSGRGGWQVYTRALVFDEAALIAAHNRPLLLYREALALGYLRYQNDPPRTLTPAQLGPSLAVKDSETLLERARALRIPSSESLRAKLANELCLRFSHQGDRIALLECLLEVLGPTPKAWPSFSTSLQPSTVRPFQIVLT
jgi:hypothetical protein